MQSGTLSMTVCPVCIQEFVRLRGRGPYEQPVMLEAALLLEECLGVVLQDNDISVEHLGSPEALCRFAAAVAREPR